MKKVSPEDIWSRLEKDLREPGPDGGLKNLVIGPHAVMLLIELGSMKSHADEYKEFDLDSLKSDSDRVNEIIFWADAHNRPWYFLRDELSPRKFQTKLLKRFHPELQGLV